MVEPISGYGSSSGINSRIMMEVNSLMADIGKVVADYFKKCEEANLQLDKVAYRELQEDALSRLTKLEQDVRDIPRTSQLQANRLLLEIEAAKKQISLTAPPM